MSAEEFQSKRIAAMGTMAKGRRYQAVMDDVMPLLDEIEEELARQADAMMEGGKITADFAIAQVAERAAVRRLRTKLRQHAKKAELGAKQLEEVERQEEFARELSARRDENPDWQ